MWFRWHDLLSGRASAHAPWLANYPANVPHSLKYPPEPLPWLLEAGCGGGVPSRTACIYYEQKLSYAELLLKARQLGTLLRQRGLQPGERVAVLLPNVPEYVISLFGIWMAGGVVVPLNPLMVAEEIADLLRDTNCRFAVCLDVLLPLIQAAPVRSNGSDHAPGYPLEKVLVTTLKDRLPYWDWLGYSAVRLRRLGFRSECRNGTLFRFDEALESAVPLLEPYRPAPESPATILPTGGTTGYPKFVVLTHHSMLSNAWQLFHWSGGRFGHDSIFAILPFFHVYGLTAGLLHGMALGATLVLRHRFDPLSALQLMEHHRPTLFLAVPTMLAALNKELRRKRRDLSSLQCCISGGSALDPKIGAEFSQHSGATVVEGYGLSEASPVTHVGPLDGNARPGTIGLPLPDTEARIVDTETGKHVLRPGELGELTIRGPQVMAGYWNDPEATAQAIRNGWLYTGDIASFDEDGFFRIVDRKKDVIITSGSNVYPSDVEQVLRKYPGLSDIAVVGIPDPDRGELVKAIVCMEKGHHLDRADFEEFAKKHLAVYKRPRVVEVLNGELPRNQLGKLLRRPLRESQSNGKAAGVEATSAVR